MRSLSFLVLLMYSTMASANLLPGDKAKVQKAMRSYVNLMTKDKSLMPVVYKGKVLRLRVDKSEKYPDGFHAGVKNKKNLYVSCVDFIDKKGNKYDIDFLVNKVGAQYSVVQPIVHSINGEKSPYDLAH